MLVVAIAGTMGPSRCRRSNHFFSDTVPHLRGQNILRAPIQSICFTPRLETLRIHTGQGYFVAGPGFGCTSPDICRRFSWVWSGCHRCGFVIMLRISSAASN